MELKTLTREELLDIYRKFDNPKKDRDSVIEAMAAAVDAAMDKLSEQEPVGYDVFGEIKSESSAKEWRKSGVELKPLYAHPMPCVSPTSDKTACVSEKSESETQVSNQVNLDSSGIYEENSGLELARHQPCGCIICYCENQERCLGCGAKHCGTHDIEETPNPVYVDHVVVTNKVDFDPDAALTLAERTLSIEITEPLAEEIVQFAHKLHEKYTQTF